MLVARQPGHLSSPCCRPPYSPRGTAPSLRRRGRRGQRAVRGGRVAGIREPIAIRVHAEAGDEVTAPLAVRLRTHLHHVAHGRAVVGLEVQTADPDARRGRVAVRGVPRHRAVRVDADDVGLEPAQAGDDLGPVEHRRLTRGDRGGGLDAPVLERARRGARGLTLEEEPTLRQAHVPGDLRDPERERAAELTGGRVRRARPVVARVAELTGRTRDRGVRALARGAEVLRARVRVVTVGIDRTLRRGLAGARRGVADLPARARHGREGAHARRAVAAVGRALVAVVADLGVGHAGAGRGRAGVIGADVRVVAHLGRGHAARGGAARVRGALVAVVARPRRVGAHLPRVAHVGRAGVLVVAVRVILTLGLRDVRIRLAARGHAELPRRAEIGTLVDAPVAVVVRVVADFGRAGEHERIALEAVLRRRVLIEPVAVEVAQVAGDGVGNVVPVAVLVAGVAVAVAVRIRLGHVHDTGAIVVPVHDAIAVVVRIARVAHRVAVQVLLVRVRDERTVVRAVEVAVVVVVGVDAVRPHVRVRVREGLVRGARAVVVDAVARLDLADPDLRVEVGAVRDVRIEVAVVVRVAGVAARHGLVDVVDVGVGVDLILVRHERTVVGRVQDTIPVFVILARVALAVLVEVLLAGVRDQIARVVVVQDPVVVVVGVALVSAVLRGVCVQLVLVLDQGAVVHGVELQVAVVVLVTGVADAVAVRVELRLAAAVHEPDAHRRRRTRHLVHRDGDEVPVRELGGRLGRAGVALGVRRAPGTVQERDRRRVRQARAVVLPGRLAVIVEPRDLDGGGLRAPDAAARGARGEEQRCHDREKRGREQVLHDKPHPDLSISAARGGPKPHHGDSAGMDSTPHGSQHNLRTMFTAGGVESLRDFILQNLNCKKRGISPF